MLDFIVVDPVLVLIVVSLRVGKCKIICTVTICDEMMSDESKPVNRQQLSSVLFVYCWALIFLPECHRRTLDAALLLFNAVKYPINIQLPVCVSLDKRIELWRRALVLV
jgi:hypothetical protein